MNVSIEKKDIAGLLGQAEYALKSGHKSVAINLLSSILIVDPGNRSAWLLMAASTNDPEKKCSYLSKATSSVPESDFLRLAAEEKDFPPASMVEMPPVSVVPPAPFMTSSVGPHEEENTNDLNIQEAVAARVQPSGQGIPQNNLRKTPIRGVTATQNSTRTGKTPQPARVRKKELTKKAESSGCLKWSLLIYLVSIIILVVVFITFIGKWNLPDFSSTIILGIGTPTSFITEYPVSPTRASLITTGTKMPDPTQTTGSSPSPALTPTPTTINEGMPVDVPPTEPPNKTPAAIESPAPSTPGATATGFFIPSSTPLDPVAQGTPTPTTLLPTATQVPALVKRIVIGRSVQTRDLEVTRFGSGAIERMLVAGVHGGNEGNTIALADQLIAHLKKHTELVPVDVTLFILRSFNPDGEAKGRNLDGRANAHGVDLNRNWNANWMADWPREGCWNYRRLNAGSFPESEPETIALRDFIQSHQIDALINYHSAALGVFPGGMPPYAPSVRLAKSIASNSKYAYPPTDTGCLYTGQFADWAALRGIAAVDLELTNFSSTDFDINLRILQILLNWKR